MASWLSAFWDPSSPIDCYNSLTLVKKPVALTNDFIMELYRRTGSVEALGLCKKYWKRQKEKDRSFASKTSLPTSSSQILMSSFQKGEQTSSIHPVFRFMREELVFPSSSFRSPLQSLSLSLEANEPIQYKNHSYVKFMDQFIQQGGILITLGLLTGPYRHSPWEPLLHFLVHLLIYSHNKKEITPPNCHFTELLKKNEETSALPVVFLDLLFHQLLTIKSPSNSFIQDTCQLWNALIHLQDLQPVQKTMQPFLCESLLRPLASVHESERRIDMDPNLKKLIDEYHTPAEVCRNQVFTTKASTKEKLFLNWFILTPFKISNTFTYQEGMPGEEVYPFTNLFFQILDLLIAITSQSITGRYVAWFLCFWRPTNAPKHQNPFFFINHLHTKSRGYPSYVKRRMGASLCSLQLNCLEYLKIKNGNITKSLVHAPMEMEAYYKQMGLSSALPNFSFFLDFMNRNLFFPQMSLRYLSMGDYFLRNFVLTKLNISASIWQDLSRNYKEGINVHPIHKYSMQKSSSCYYHRSEHKISFEIASSHLLTHSGKKSSHDSPAPLFFLLSCNLDTSEIDNFVAVEYCSHKHAKGNSTSIQVFGHVDRATVPYLERKENFFNLVFIGNPALIASCEIHQAIHDLVIRSTKEDVFPSWFEKMMSGKESPSSLFVKTALFSESHDWLHSPDASIKVLGLLEPSVMEEFLVSSLSASKPRKSSNSHLPSTICSQCSLGIDRIKDEKEEEKYEEREAENFAVSLRCPNVDSYVLHKSYTKDAFVSAPIDFTSFHKTGSLQLYKSQQDAFMSAALFRRVTLIIGPPGTGKTSTTTHILRSWYHNFHSGSPQATKYKILLLAQSNNAVDQLVERLAPYNIPLVRLGRQSKSEIANTKTFQGIIDAKITGVSVLAEKLMRYFKPNSECCTILKEVQNRITQNAKNRDFRDSATILRPFLENQFFKECRVLDKFYKGKETFSEAERSEAVVNCFSRVGLQLVRPSQREDVLSYCVRRFSELRNELKFLAIESFHDQKEEILKSIAIVAATCSGFVVNRHSVKADMFSSVIIEEAGKVLEAECLSAFSVNLRRLVLVGDDQQMRSLVYDDRLKNHSEFDQPLLLRLQRLGVIPIILNEQTRALPSIADMYRWRYPNLKDHTSTTLISPIMNTNTAAFFVHVNPIRNQRGEENREELKQVLTMAHQLITTRNIAPDHITILTPYRKQKNLFLRSSNYVDMQIHTVDEYQGEENSVILLSLAFSGHQPSPFLCDERRINVMTSRAKQLFILFGNTKALQRSPAWERVLTFLSPSSNGK